jgi:hypothetical protein
MRRRWMLGKPWSSLLWGLAAFAVFQVGLAVAVEHRFQNVRDPEYADKLKRLKRAISSKPGRPLILMLGSSRTFTGFEAAALCESPDSPAIAFNFGLTGGCSFLELVCLERLLAEGIRPELLLVEVLPASLNQLDDRPLEEIWLSGTRLRTAEMAILDPYHSDPSRLVRHWCKARALPCAWNAGELQRHLGLDVRSAQPGVNADDIDALGWRSCFPGGLSAEERARKTAGARLQYRTAFGDFHLADGPARAQGDLLARCRHERIDTAMVLMPEGSAFRSWYTPSMRSGIDAFLKNLSQEHKVPLIDARTWIADDGFWDGHHLLAAGARAFTKRLQTQLVHHRATELTE